MTSLRPNTEQWRVIFATFVAVLFLQRDRLREPFVGTAFVLVGALLLLWRFSGGKALQSADAHAHPATKTSTLTVVGVLVALAIAAFYLSNRPSQNDVSTASSIDYNNAPPSEPGFTAEHPPERAPIGQGPMTPAGILQEYVQNQFEAFNRYSGRYVQIAAEVAAIGGRPNEMQYAQIVIRSQSKDYMQAMFPKNVDQLRKLKPGDRVIFSCIPVYDGDWEMVTLDECSVVK